MNTLAPFAYHNTLRDHFKQRKKTWEWFQSDTIKEKQITKFKSDLLKNTYRLDKTSHPEVYEIIREIQEILFIDADVTVYQEYNSTQLNAGISIVEKEAHIVLSGNLLKILSPEEVKAVLAHELSHYLFFKIEDGSFEVTQRIIIALANDYRSDDAYIQTARIYQLYLELYCDAGSLLVCKDYKTVISALVKMNTGLSEVNADSYILQAEEIIKKDPEASKNFSHPEAYIRSLALKYSRDKELSPAIEWNSLIKGALDLETLDIFQQKEVQKYTRDILKLIIAPDWMNTSTVQNLCKKYFSDFTRTAKGMSVDELADIIKKAKTSIHDYFSYVLLDFARVDADLEELALGYTLEIAEQLQLQEAYSKIIRKELKLTTRAFKMLQERILRELVKVNENGENGLYQE